MGVQTRSGFGDGDDPADPPDDDAAGGPRVARTVFGRELHLPALLAAAEAKRQAGERPVASNATSRELRLTPVPSTSPPEEAATEPLRRSGRAPRATGTAIRGRVPSYQDVDPWRVRQSTLRQVLLVCAAALVSFSVVGLLSWYRLGRRRDGAATETVHEAANEAVRPTTPSPPTPVPLQPATSLGRRPSSDAVPPSDHDDVVSPVFGSKPGSPVDARTGAGRPLRAPRRRPSPPANHRSLPADPDAPMPFRL